MYTLVAVMAISYLSYLHPDIGSYINVMSVVDCPITLRISAINQNDKVLPGYRFLVSVPGEQRIGATNQQGIMVFEGINPSGTTSSTFSAKRERGISRQEVELTISSEEGGKLISYIVPCSDTTSIILRIHTPDNMFNKDDVQVNIPKPKPTDYREWLPDDNISITDIVLMTSCSLFVLIVMYTLSVKIMNNIFRELTDKKYIAEISSVLIGIISATLFVREYDVSNPIISQFRNGIGLSVGSLLSIVFVSISGFLFWQRIKAFFRGGWW